LNNQSTQTENEIILKNSISTQTDDIIIDNSNDTSKVIETTSSSISIQPIQVQDDNKILTSANSLSKRKKLFILFILKS
jgi:hypothetical protein